MEGDSGFAIGVFNTQHFNSARHNLGASPGTWCYSRTGKRSSGAGFVEYGDVISVGDVVGVEVNMAT